LNEIDIDGIGFTSQRTRDRLVARLEEGGIRDERVLGVIGRTPRHLFVDEALSHRAYEDTALPIGHQQTISQPYVVARMTEALIEHGVPGSVLEIGTGCGYQTAVLAQLVGQVLSVERIRPLLDRARTRLRELRVRNAQLRHADGGIGWADRGPFDGILVTAAPRSVPTELLDQLAVGGRMVIPVGDGGVQELRRLTRTPEGIETERLGTVRFVPLVGGTVR
jgi:protein-L-isoaspartate(D-aspartate) O-methyltransferase